MNIGVVLVVAVVLVALFWLVLVALFWLVGDGGGGDGVVLLAVVIACHGC